MLFLEEIWSRNFTNLFIAPMKISEIINFFNFHCFNKNIDWISASHFINISIIWNFNSKFGSSIIFFIPKFVYFWDYTWLFVSSGFLRFGPSFENIAWSSLFLLAPLGCIYYPIEILPEIFK